MAHLLRELKFVEDSTGYLWASELKELLKSTVELVAKKKDKVLTKKEYEEIRNSYLSILTTGLEELPPFPNVQG